VNSALGSATAEYHPGRKSIVNGLATIFNVVALTLVVVVLALTVIGLPLGFSAASSAIYDWRKGGESRVMRTLWYSLLDRPLRRTTAVGPALLAAAAGATEVIYFLHYAGPIAALCLVVGVVTFAAGVSFAGYLLLLVTVAPDAGWVELWRAAGGIVARTSVLAGPVFLLEAAGAAVIGFADPALLVVAVPVVLLWCWQRTAIWGARRAGLAI
jgi:hypothetical protein